MNIKEPKHLMKLLKNKFVQGAFVLGVLGYGVHLYCELTGNNHEPQRGREAQDSIGKLCDISDLKSFGAPAQSGDASAFYMDDFIDGTKPARHETVIKTLSSRSEIKQHYEEACQHMGYTLNDPSLSGDDVACSKWDGEYNKDFSAQAKCDGAECRVVLELLTGFYH
jgi:hypothetical protein